MARDGQGNFQGFLGAIDRLSKPAAIAVRYTLLAGAFPIAAQRLNLSATIDTDNAPAPLAYNKLLSNLAGDIIDKTLMSESFIVKSMADFACYSIDKYYPEFKDEVLECFEFYRNWDFLLQRG